MDNLPPKLIPKFAEACNTGQINKVALVMDIRGGVFFDDLFESLEYLRKNNFKYEILFLDCSDEVLVKRFKQNRRSHPFISIEEEISISVLSFDLNMEYQ